MNPFTRLSINATMPRIGTVACVSLLASLASAGTYSIVGKSWFPASSPGSGTNGGYCAWDEPNYPLDIKYGYARTDGAPNTAGDSVSVNITATGMWKWKVRWVPSFAGETPPYQVGTTVQIKGGSSATTNASCLSYSGVTGQGTAYITDPYFLIAQFGSLTNSPDTYDTDSRSTPNASHFEFPGITFTQVAGQNVWEGELPFSISSQAQITGSGSSNRFRNSKGLEVMEYKSGGGGTVNLAAKIRLTHVGGQRVQLDL